MTLDRTPILSADGALLLGGSFISGSIMARNYSEPFQLAVFGNGQFQGVIDRKDYFGYVTDIASGKIAGDATPKVFKVQLPQEPTKIPEPGPTPTCPDPNTLILLSDGSQKRAGDLQVGDVVRTQHEDTLEWGEHKVTYVETTEAEKLVLTFDHVEFICSTSHKFYVEGKGWTEVNQIEVGDFVIGLEQSHKLLEVRDSSYGDVVVIQVEDAHTYISEGLLSHNKTREPSPIPQPPTPGPSPDPGFPVIPPSPSGGGELSFLVQ